jgi:hypothetical protein
MRAARERSELLNLQADSLINPDYYDRGYALGLADARRGVRDVPTVHLRGYVQGYRDGWDAGDAARDHASRL